MSTTRPAGASFATAVSSSAPRQVRREGQKKGRQEGAAQGRAELVARQLTIRFGVITDDARARIAAANADELDAIAERLLTAKTLEEALG